MRVTKEELEKELEKAKREMNSLKKENTFLRIQLRQILSITHAFQK